MSPPCRRDSRHVFGPSSAPSSQPSLRTGQCAWRCLNRSHGIYDMSESTKSSIFGGTVRGTDVVSLVPKISFTFFYCFFVKIMEQKNDGYRTRREKLLEDFLRRILEAAGTILGSALATALTIYLTTLSCRNDRHARS